MVQADRLLKIRQLHKFIDWVSEMASFFRTASRSFVQAPNCFINAMLPVAQDNSET